MQERKSGIWDGSGQRTAIKFPCDWGFATLNLTIAAINYYYLTNRYTGSFVYQRDMMAKEALEERLAFNLETIRRLVRA